MKFLCDQCKAKYQITDDKVVGKTVRMKCRKCGHMIEVRAAVTESSVSAGLPSDRPPAPGGAPRPGAPLAKAPLATSFAQVKPAPPRPAAARAETASAAARAAQEREGDGDPLHEGGADKWYAAINGVPVGPISVADLRRKASLGAVTEESLVWQEGMEEWRPARTVAEVAAILREATAAAKRTAATPEPPPVHRPSGLPPTPSPSMRPAPPRPPPPRAAPQLEPPRPGQIAARTHVAASAFASRLATAERLDEAPVVQPAPTPSPLPPPTSERVSIAPEAISAPVERAHDGASPPAAEAPAPPQRQPPWIVIGMLVGFAAFGITLALVMRPQTQQAPQVIVQQVPIAQATAATPTAATPVSEPVASAPAAKPAVRGPAPAPKPATSAPQGLDLSGLLGTQAGPSAGGGPGEGAGGAGLSEGQLTGVVNAHKIAVRRTCFERLGVATNANETVRVTIDPGGHVASASAEGDNSTVGNCLEKEIRAWAFPSSGSTTRTVLPFHFVLQ